MKLVTQNVDGLHGEYPNEQLVEIHGRLGMLKCISEGGYVNESIKRMRPFWAILLSTCWLASPIVIVSLTNLHAKKYACRGMKERGSVRQRRSMQPAFGCACMRACMCVVHASCMRACVPYLAELPSMVSVEQDCCIVGDAKLFQMVQYPANFKVHKGDRGL